MLSRSNKLPAAKVLQRIQKRMKHSGRDYQYLQVSKIPTMHFQPSLPRLPVPKLELTCERYLAAQKPLLTEEAFRRTKSNVTQFRDTTGKLLQDVLKAEDNKNKRTSYISEPWFDMYLRDRKPLPINYNPMIVLNNFKENAYNDQLIKATNMLISSLRFYKSLKGNVLEPEVFHLNSKKSDTETFRNICASVPSFLSWYAAYLQNAYPLDMSQYSSLFGTTRIPKVDKDEILRELNPKHILVQRRGHFYNFDVFDENGDILPADLILTRLKHVLNDERRASDCPIGVFTSLDRNEWADIRNHLLSLGNEQVLSKIDTALFNICLDEEIVGWDPIDVTKQFLHGTGVNRWFDKSFSLQCSKDGIVGINFEHSWGDGVAVLRYLQDIHRDARENPQVHPDTQQVNDHVSNVSRLDIIVDDRIKHHVFDAQKKFGDTYNSLDINYLIFDGLGKKICKKNLISPDAVMQLGFQAAYYKQTGKFAPTYESCSTAAFKHGRTEAIRPNTVATKAYSLAANRTEKPGAAELKFLVTQCSKVHSQLTKEAAMGQGFDRHLFALRLIAARNHTPCSIFEDPSYKYMNHNIISTSTLSSPAVFAGSFGPVVKDGLGIAYIINDDSLGVLVTSYPPNNSGTDFITALQPTFECIRDSLREN